MSKNVANHKLSCDSLKCIYNVGCIVWWWWHIQQLLYHSFLPTVCQKITTTVVGRLFPQPHHPQSFFTKWFAVTTCCWYLYILNRMLYYNSWTILKPIHYHLAPDLNTDTRILHTILQPGRHTHTHTTVCLRNEKEQWQKHCISNLFFHLIKRSWFWLVDILRMFLIGWGCAAVPGWPLKFHTIISVFMDELLNKVRYMVNLPLNGSVWALRSCKNCSNIMFHLWDTAT